MVAADNVKTSQQRYFQKNGLQKYMFTKENYYMLDYHSYHTVFSILIVNIVLMLLQAVLLPTTYLFTQRWTHLTPKLQSKGTLFFKELRVHYLT